MSEPRRALWRSLYVQVLAAIALGALVWMIITPVIFPQRLRDRLQLQPS
jgi:hypothetical protein